MSRLCLDTSGSTAEPTGADINGNGVIGAQQRGRISSLFGGSTDDGDSILAAEVAAARQILRDFDPRTTRVAVITFAGGDGAREDRSARTDSTAAHERIRSDRTGARLHPARGASRPLTHISGAVDHSTTELTRIVSGRVRKSIANSEKLVFFFTDGQPTLPFGQARGGRQHVRAVRRSALRANKAGIRIHSFAIGPEALAGPIASVELADMTGGSFIPVRHPGELSAVVDALNFANLEDVNLQSETTGRRSRSVPRDSRRKLGWFREDGARLQHESGSRRGRRMASKPSKCSTSSTSQPPRPLSIPADLGIRHNRLLEDCLRNLKQLRVVAEKEAGRGGAQGTAARNRARARQGSKTRRRTAQAARTRDRRNQLAGEFFEFACGGTRSHSGIAPLAGEFFEFALRRRTAHWAALLAGEFDLVVIAGRPTVARRCSCCLR